MKPLQRWTAISSTIAFLAMYSAGRAWEESQTDFCTAGCYHVDGTYYDNGPSDPPDCEDFQPNACQDQGPDSWLWVNADHFADPETTTQDWDCVTTGARMKYVGCDLCASGCKQYATDDVSYREGKDYDMCDPDDYFETDLEQCKDPDEDPGPGL